MSTIRPDSAIPGAPPHGPKKHEQLEQATSTLQGHTLTTTQPVTPGYSRLEHLIPSHSQQRPSTIHQLQHKVRELRRGASGIADRVAKASEKCVTKTPEAKTIAKAGTLRVIAREVEGLVRFFEKTAASQRQYYEPNTDKNMLLAHDLQELALSLAYQADELHPSNNTDPEKLLSASTLRAAAKTIEAKVKSLQQEHTQGARTLQEFAHSLRGRADELDPSFRQKARVRLAKVAAAPSKAASVVRNEARYRKNDIRRKWKGYGL